MRSHSKLPEQIWNRILRHGTAIGQKTIYSVLLLYYAFRRKETPLYARSIILGALGYFLALFDAIPDLSPVLGYTDDLGVLTFGLVSVAAYINDDVRIHARKAVRKIFPTVDLESLQSVDAKL